MTTCRKTSKATTSDKWKDAAVRFNENARIVYQLIKVIDRLIFNVQNTVELKFQFSNDEQVESIVPNVVRQPCLQTQNTSEC